MKDEDKKKRSLLEKEKGDATGNFGKESSDKPSSSVKKREIDLLREKNFLRSQS